MNRNSSSTAHDSDLDMLRCQVQAQLTGRIKRLQIFQQKNGIVLQGYARTYYAKQLAQHAVMRATDVPIVANEIEVA
ncbi:MAG TPA: hypothetical protein VFE62_18615 [Gemmataceae bacterium]|nr:hypothetical protein [Gemmataceae bacterium]